MTLTAPRLTSETPTTARRSSISDGLFSYERRHARRAREPRAKKKEIEKKTSQSSQVKSSQVKSSQLQNGGRQSASFGAHRWRERSGGQMSNRHHIWIALSRGIMAMAEAVNGNDCSTTGG